MRVFEEKKLNRTRTVLWQEEYLNRLMNHPNAINIYKMISANNKRIDKINKDYYESRLAQQTPMIVSIPEISLVTH